MKTTGKKDPETIR